MASLSIEPSARVEASYPDALAAPGSGAPGSAAPGSTALPARLRIGAALFDTRNFELVRNGVATLLQPLPARLLHHLLCHRDRIVTKQELHRVLWPQTFVSDAALASALRDLRRAIGDDGKSQDFVRTFRGRGYRLVAPVTIEAERSHLEAVPEAGFGARHSPCVGRPQELEQLRQTLEQVRQGRGACVLVEGEPGSGKSDLLARFQDGVEGATCVAVSCGEESWVPRYDTMGQALLQLESAVGRPRFETWVGQPGALVEILPELASGSEASFTLHAVERRLARFLAKACQDGPLVLCFDDFHLADGGSWSLLQAVSRQAASLPLLVLGTVDRSRLPRRLEKSLRGGLAPERWLRLKELSVAAAARLAESALGEPADREWARRFRDHSGGCAGPLVALLDEAARSKTRLPQPESLPVPASVSAAVRRRWQRLSPGARRVVVASAALPWDVGTDQVVALAGLGEGAAGALSEAVEARFLNLRADTMKVRPRSALLQRAILGLLPSERQRQLSHRAGKVLDLGRGG